MDDSSLFHPDCPILAVYAFTRQGLLLARRLSPAFSLVLHAPESLRNDAAIREFMPQPVWFSSLADMVGRQFHSYSCHLFIAAAGIAVRAIAPHLRDKTRDPAVLVTDQRGKHVISLLSGHVGGGNALALAVAKALGAVPVITTATDGEGLPAIDALARERGLSLGDPTAAKRVSAALLAGERVLLHDPANALGLRGSPWEDLFPAMPATDPTTGTLSPVFPFFASPLPPNDAFAPARVIVTPVRAENITSGTDNCLILHPRVVHAGIGCRRGADAASIHAALRAVLAWHALAPESLASLASISAKESESGLRDCAGLLSLPLLFFPPHALAAYPARIPSPKARALFGVEGVCEPAALAAAEAGGGKATLLAEKTVLGDVTVALALSLP